MGKVGRARCSFILIVILAIIISMAEPGLCEVYWNRKYHVHLLNRMSSNAEPLMVHVKSGSDDLGEHAVWVNGDFQFHFKLSFWGTTLFYCTFKHGMNQRTFDVFVEGDSTSESYICYEPNKTVYWKVTDDGFYRSCDDKNYDKLQAWNI